MPKDPKKNVDRYKIRGGDINEFEYHQNQEALAEEKDSASANLIPGTPPEVKAQEMRPVVVKKPAKKAAPNKAAKKKATKATKKATKKKAAVAARGASPKKLAAQKSAKKKAAKKK